jgi:L-serine dehydratase
MAETGAGAGMAAAAIVWMAGGTLNQSIGAASLALQNSLGLICDPIGNRVEAPCLGRNVMAATNAVSCANMALSDYRHLIPLDEVISTMKAVGDQIHNTLRCTNLGGLSITPTAKNIEASLGSGTKAFYKNC